MKNTRLFLTFLLTLSLLLAALPGLPAFGLDDDFAPLNPPSADSEPSDSFAPGEVLAPADSLRQAQDIADFYGLRLKSYAYGIAVLVAPDPPKTVVMSKLISMSMGVMSVKIPSLSLNRIYHAEEVAYNRQDPVYEYTRPLMPNYPDEYSAGDKPQSEPLLYNAKSTVDSYLQWQHQAMDNDRAWDISSGKNVVVAIIDSGIDIDHPDFAGRILPQSYNSHTDQIGLAYVQDDNMHGTHVSGIAAGALNDAAGVCGVAFEALILTIKANNPTDPRYFYMDSLLRGINYAAQNGADIINMSLGRSYYDGPDSLEQAVIAQAVASGVTVVCAAGNSSESHAGYPAAYVETIAVSALKEGCLFDSDYSCYGPEIDVAAPGTSIYSAASGGGYISFSGTSMASPCVAGVAALIKALHPEYSPQQVRDTICQTARDTDQIGRDDFYGYGVVNSYAALLGQDALYNVTFDFNDGSRPPVTIKAAPGNTLLASDTPQREGYVFAGWFIKETDAWFNFVDAVTSDLNLYAKWVIPEDGMYIFEFPDPNFRREVLRLLSESGVYSADGSIIGEEDMVVLASYANLNVEYMSISDMTGLKYFSGLKTLWCSGNLLTTLDMTNNTALTELRCHTNQLKELDVSKNTALTELWCYINRLKELDVSKNTALTELRCNNNQLEELDVSKNTALTELSCYDNQLMELDVSKNIALTELSCYGNQLMELDVSKNTALTELWCYRNYLGTLNVSQNNALTDLQCDYNRLTVLDVSQNNALIYLYCSNNELTALDISRNTALEYLQCSYNRLKELDVSQNSALTDLRCYNNQLMVLDLLNNAMLELLVCDNNRLLELDLTKNTMLKNFSCENNQLNYLDVSKNSMLESLYCTNNQLSALNVLNNTELQYLLCANNKLTELDISNNTKLGGSYSGFIAIAGLDCSGNQLSALDLSKNTDLKFLFCTDNQLTALDVSGNTSLQILRCSNNQLSALDVSNNSELLLLWCANNQLTELDVTNNTSLCGNWGFYGYEAGLDCSGNQLTTLDLSKNYNLYYLICANNQLTELDVSNNPELQIMMCSNNQLTALDVSNNSRLWHLNCSYNYMRSIDDVKGWRQIGLVLDEGFFFYPQNDNDAGGQNTFLKEFPDPNFRREVLRLLNADGKNRTDDTVMDANDIEALAQFTSLIVQSMDIGDLTGLKYFTGIECLYCANNKLTELDTSHNIKLSGYYYGFFRYAGLDCNGNQLSALDLSKNTDLQVLLCGDNQLKELDVSNNTALQVLECPNNQLNVLDVSNNIALMELNCADNQLSELDISKNTNLCGILGLFGPSAGLDCSGNQLLTLDLSKNTHLSILKCGGNQLTELNVSNNPELQIMLCSNNQLTALDVSNNSWLWHLACSYNYMRSTDDVKGWRQIGLILDEGFHFYPQNDNDAGGQNTFLKEFPDPNFRREVLRLLNADDKNRTDYTDMNAKDIEALAQFTSLNVQSMDIGDLTGLKYFTGLENLYCGYNKLTELDLSYNTKLSGYYDGFFRYAGLECSGNQLSALDLSKQTALQVLFCGGNQLKELDVSNNTALQVLKCTKNQLSVLDVSKNTALIELNCADNRLSELDISKNINLCGEIGFVGIEAGLDCSGNQLLTLDLSKNTNLSVLQCGDNQLTELDVSKNPELQIMMCSNNQLTALDVSNNSWLWHLACSYNYMRSTDDVKGWRQIGLILDESFFFHPQNQPPIQEKTYAEAFPDQNFRAEVLKMINEQDNGARTESSPLSENDQAKLAAFTVLTVSNKNIADLAGLSYFSGITYLNCSVNQLSKLDVSGNTKLASLYCFNNQLSEIDLTGNVMLSTLNCSNNSLSELKFPDNSEMRILTCSGNKLTALTVSTMLKLRSLECTNNELTTLDVAKNSALEYLNCAYNYLKSPNDVIGWQEIGLTINRPDNLYSGTFRFYVQL